MELFQTQALILKTTVYRDKDIIVHFLTDKYGKKNGIIYGARSLRSTFRGMSEPFNQLGIEFAEKEHAEMITVQSADIQESHVHLRKNYHFFLLASYFTELMHIAIIPDPESEAYFFLLKNALQKLPSKQGIKVNKLEFELKLLHLLGVFPQLENCVICTKPITKHKGAETVLNKNLQYLIDVVQGGIRCQECYGRDSNLIPLNPGSLMFLNRWHETLRHSKDPSVVPTRQNLIEVNPIIQASFKLHLPRMSKAHAMLEKGLEANH